MTEKKDLPETPEVEETVEAEATPVEEEGKDLIALACRAVRRDGSKGCGGTQAERIVIPNGPTFYVCQQCSQRWIPVDIGGSYPY